MGGQGRGRLQVKWWVKWKPCGLHGKSRLEGGEGMVCASVWRKTELWRQRPAAGVPVPSTLRGDQQAGLAGAK